MTLPRAVIFFAAISVLVGRSSAYELTLDVPAFTSETFTSNFTNVTSSNLHIVKTGAGTLVMQREGDQVVTGSTTINDGTVVLSRPTGLGNRNLPNGTIELKSGATLINSIANQIGDLTTIAMSNATVTFNASEYLGGITMRDNSLINGASTIVLNGTQTAGLNAVGGGNAGLFSANFAMASSWTDGSTANNPRTGNGTTPIFVETGTSLTISGRLVDGLESSPIGSMSKSGAGTLILNGNSEYRGATSITGGTVVMNGTNRAYFWNGSAMVYSNSGAITVSNANLVVNGSLTGQTTVQSGATLGGSGTLNTVTVQSGGTLAPGNSPGLMTATNGVSLATGSTFQWELIGNTVEGRGTNFDAVNVTGGTLSIGTGVTSSLVFNTAGSTVSWSDAFWSENRSWLVFDNANSPTLDSGAVFDTINPSTDSLGVSLTSVRANATFAWSQQGSDVYLTYTAVPEPSTYALLVLTAAGLGVHVIRRRKAKANA